MLCIKFTLLAFVSTPLNANTFSKQSQKYTKNCASFVEEAALDGFSSGYLSVPLVLLQKVINYI